MTSLGGFGSPPAPRADHGADPAPPAPLRILLVEDSPDDAELLARALAAGGLPAELHRVASAAQMQAALAEAEWDAILADHSLPGFSAEGALAILHASGRDLPFIIVSGTIDETRAVATLRAGAHDFVTKANLARLGPAIEREVRDAGNRRAHRQVEARLSLTMDSMREGAQIIGFDWRYLYVNDAIAAQGRKSRQEMLGRTMQDVYPGIEQTPLFAVLQRCMTQRVAQQLENEFRYADGSKGWFRLSIQPVPEGLFILSEDIAEWKRGEIGRQALLEIMQGASITDDLHTFLGLVHQAIAKVMYAENFFVTLYNEATGLFEEAYSVDQFDPPGPPSHSEKTISAYVFRSGQPLLLDQARFDELVAQGEVALVGTNSPSWLGVPLNTATGTIGVMVVQDYEREGRYTDRDTEFLASMAGQVALAVQRKQARAQLHLQTSALEASANAIVITDTAGVIRWINPAFTQLTGYSADEAIGQTPRLFKSGQHGPEFYQRLWRTILAGESFQAEMQNKRKDGSLYIEEMTIAPVRTPGGEISHFIAVKQDITERKAAEAQNQRQLDRLSALRVIDLAISGSLDLRVTLDIFLDQVISRLNVDAADVLLMDSRSHALTYMAGRGFRSSSRVQQVRVRLGEGRAGRAALERRIIVESGSQAAYAPSRRTGLLGQDKFVSYHGVPLIAKGQVLGVLEVFHRSPLRPDHTWLEFLEALAGQAAIAIENAMLFEGLQTSHTALVSAYDATIEGWSRALDLRDHETEGHTLRVTETTLRLARTLGVADGELVHVRRGALLHDIGKLGVPDHILLKPGPLTDDEWAIMRQHPVHAYEMLLPIAYLRPALDIPYCHHEKWDGTGYPRALKGEAIPLSARIFAVVDVWDALRSDRPYRPAWSGERVRAHLRGLRGTHLEPRLVDAFLKLIE
jgi:PAS domain S-box-containing protein/putative nucleotidyltransferase with HDIG domain